MRTRSFNRTISCCTAKCASIFINCRCGAVTGNNCFGSIITVYPFKMIFFIFRFQILATGAYNFSVNMVSMSVNCGVQIYIIVAECIKHNIICFTASSASCSSRTAFGTSRFNRNYIAVISRSMPCCRVFNSCCSTAS